MFFLTTFCFCCLTVHCGAGGNNLGVSAGGVHPPKIYQHPLRKIQTVGEIIPAVDFILLLFGLKLVLITKRIPNGNFGVLNPTLSNDLLHLWTCFTFITSVWPIEK